MIGNAPAGIVVKAEQLRLSCPQRGKPTDQVARIVFVAFLSAFPARAKQLFTGLAQRQRRQRGLLRGIQKRDQPAIRQPFFCGSMSRGSHLLRTESVKLVNIIHHQPSRLIRRQQALVELAGQGGGFGIQRFQLGFFIGVQTRARKNKVLIRHLRQSAGFGIQRVAILPDGFHAGEKRIV